MLLSRDATALFGRAIPIRKCTLISKRETDIRSHSLQQKFPLQRLSLVQPYALRGFATATGRTHTVQLLTGQSSQSVIPCTAPLQVALQHERVGSQQLVLPAVLPEDHWDAVLLQGKTKRGGKRTH